VRFAAWLLTWSVACLSFSGCGSMPSSPSPSTPPGGRLTLRSITPGSGTTLLVRECGSDGLDVTCTEEPRVSIDVDVPHDINDPALSMTLKSSSRECGGFNAMQPRIARPLKAGPYVFEFTGVYLSATGANFELDCPLPAETTRLIVRLWEITAAGIPTEVISQEFAHTYRFEKR
jgi:hypothetical protein